MPLTSSSSHLSVSPSGRMGVDLNFVIILTEPTRETRDKR
jgi:hypothetical protein